LVLILSSDLTSDNQKDLQTKIKKIVSDLKGEVKKADEWGKKEFTYPIKKIHSGYYFLWVLGLPETEVNALDKKLRQEENLLRYLLVKSEGRPVAKAASVKTTAAKKGKRGTKIAK